MNAWFRGSLVVVSSLLASCALESTEGPPRRAATDAEERLLALQDASKDQRAPEVPSPTEVMLPALHADQEPADTTRAPEVPSGVFESIAELCRVQQVMVAQDLRAVEAARRDYEAEFTLKPSCAVAPHALENTKITLGGPFLEVSAITATLDRGTGTFLAVRTALGWHALPRASAVDHYNDPGCFSIERDGGIAQITVMGPNDAPALVVLETTTRGDHMEHNEDEEHQPPIMWDEIKTRASACHLGALGFACDPHQVVRLELVPSTTEGDRKSALRFRTSYRVDDAGTLRTEATYSNEQPDE